MNYKSVRYFSPLARGDCSLTWQWGWAQIGTQSGDSQENALSGGVWESVGMEGWKDGRGNGWRGGWMEGQKDERTGRWKEPQYCPEARQELCAWHVGRSSLGGAQAMVWTTWAGSGVPRQHRGCAKQHMHPWHCLLLLCHAQFHQSQWHLINVQLLWIRGGWGVYVSIALYHWAWFYFCSHQFDTDTVPLASMTWICILTVSARSHSASFISKMCACSCCEGIGL